MQLTDSQIQELRIGFIVWRAIEQSEDRPYPAKDDLTFRRLAERATRYGALSGAMSAWTRAAKELSDEGVIKLSKPAPQPRPIPADFAAQIDAMSSSELRKRLNTDRAFAELFERFAGGERPEGTTATDDPYADLTKAQWHALPPNTAARLMTNPQFRKAVDRLIAAGQI
jgi:hypothetical protein